MKSNKKTKIRKLNFYIVSDRYIKYLSQYDNHIAYNKNQTRPYIGVIIQVKEYNYFAPLFSPKPKHKTYKDNLSFFKITNIKTKNELGIIRFTDMIPVPENEIQLLDIKKRAYGYKRLLSEQYSIINNTNNKQKIINKAETIYSIVTDEKNKGKKALFYKFLSCNFKLLEKKQEKYNKSAIHEMTKTK